MSLYITKLNHALLFNIIIFLVLIVIVIFRFTILKPQSHYLGNETEIIGKIINIKVSNEYTKLVIKGKEKIEVIYYEKISFSLGDQVKIIGSLKKPDTVKVFNVFQYSNYLKSQKIYWQFKANKIVLIRKNKQLIYKIKNRLNNYLDSFSNSDYLKAFIIGDNSQIDGNIKERINNLGIAHLFALSGMHVSFLSLIIFKILNIVFSNKTTIFIWLLLLISYLLITTLSPSIIRAITCTIIIKVFKIKPINILLILCMILLIVNPYYIYSLGFLFSFIISLFLILFKNRIDQRKRYFTKLIYTSYIAFIVSIPILSYNFFEINLLTPIINLIFIPFVTFILFPIILITFLIPALSFISNFVIIIFELLINILDIFILNINLPKLPTLFYVVYFIITILILKNKKYNYLFFLFLVFHSAIYSNFLPATITMIDVGQGDSTLIKMPNNKGNILIDTGGITTSNNLFLAKNRIIPYLKSMGIKKLDYLILTHGDSDHIKEALYLVDHFPIKKVLLNSGSNNTLENMIITKLTKNNIKYYCVSTGVFKINNHKFYIFNKRNINDENKDSLIVYTKINKRNIILMGDASKEEEKYLINEYEIPKMDIIKIGHHGSKTSSDNDFIKVINPKISLISVGNKNIYNHPNREVIDVLNSNKVKIYQTKDNGSVRIDLKTMKIKKYVS